MMQAGPPAKQLGILQLPVVRNLLVVALLAEMGYAVLNISAMPMYLTVERGFGASVVGVALVGFLLSEAIFKGPMGHLADRYGCRTLMVVGPSVTVMTSLVTLAIPKGGGIFEVAPLILLRVLDGVGAAMLWPAAFALMGDSVDDRLRQQGMSLLNLCYLLGVAMALPVGGMVNDLSGSKNASLYLSSGLFLLVAIAIWRLMPKKSEQRVQHTAEGEFRLSDLMASARHIPEYLALSVVTFAGIGFPMAIVKIFARDQFNMSESQFGFLIVLPGAIAMAILSVPMSKWGERLGRSRAVHWGMGLCSMGLALVSLGGIFPLFQAAWVIAAAVVPVGIGFLLAIPAWMASVSDVDPKHRAANLGAVMTAQGIGAIIGAPLGALFYDKLFPGSALGRYSPFIGCTACIAVGWLLSLRILRDTTRATAIGDSG